MDYSRFKYLIAVVTSAGLGVLVAQLLHPQAVHALSCDFGTKGDWALHKQSVVTLEGDAVHDEAWPDSASLTHSESAGYWSFESSTQSSRHVQEIEHRTWSCR